MKQRVKDARDTELTRLREKLGESTLERRGCTMYVRGQVL